MAVYQRVGTTFGKYTIRRVLGAGGMAAVYYAIQSETEQPVALKVLTPRLAEIDAFRQRFEWEAHITARLAHPNIVSVYDFGAVEETLYIAMRYLDGGSLHDRFVIEGTVGLQETAGYLTQLAGALDYAHAQGVIHRDLKLANVLLDNERNALLSDFGIARLIESSMHLTDSGSVLGSPHYMSPEQNEGKLLDSRSDLYSLAVMIYLMITGQFPFHADTPVAIALQHVTKPPPLPTSVNPELPSALDAVLLKGLAKAPADRFTTASEFCAAFTRALGTYDTRTMLRLAQLNRMSPPILDSVGNIVQPAAASNNGEHLAWTVPAVPVIDVPLAAPAPAIPAPYAMPGAVDATDPTAQNKVLRRRKGRRRGQLILLSLVTVAVIAAVVVILFRSSGLAVVMADPRTATAAPISTLTGGNGNGVITATRDPHTTISTPTPSAVPALALNFSAISKDLYTPVNVRSGPGKDFDVIGQLYTSDVAQILARTTPTNPSITVWYLVHTLQGKTGWVSGDVIDVLPTSIDPQRVPIALTIPPTHIPVIAQTPSPSRG
jgi:serine/threonine-protein kinase